MHFEYLHLVSQCFRGMKQIALEVL